MYNYYSKSTTTSLLCLTLIVSLALTIYSCRKNQLTDTAGNPVTYQVDLNALKLSYANDTLTAKAHVFDVGSGATTATKLITDLNVKWDKLYYARRKDSRLLEFNLESIAGVTTPGKPDSTRHIHYADKASLIFLQFDNKTEMRFFMKVIETVSDTGTSVIEYLHYNNIPATFTGRILYYSIDKRFINGWYYENGKPKSEFLPQGSSSANGKTVQSMAGGKNNSDIIMHCQDWYWFYTTGEIDFIETTCVEEIRSDGNDSGGNGGDGSSGNNSNCNPPSGPQGPPSTPPTGGIAEESYRNISVLGGNIQVMDANGCPDIDNSTISDQDIETATPLIDNNKPINPNKYINCFTDGKTASQYVMTIYVDQPVYGSNDWWSLSTNSSDNIYTTTNGKAFNVGHTFVGFEKDNTDGSSVTQVMGFYPGSTALSAQGVIKDNGDHHYTEKYSVVVDATHFNAALTGVVNDSATANYTLTNGISGNSEYNCTDAAKSWFGAAGIGLPTTSRWPFTNSPGDFGEAIMSVSGAGAGQGHAPLSHGPCN